MPEALRAGTGLSHNPVCRTCGAQGLRRSWPTPSRTWLFVAGPADLKPLRFANLRITGSTKALD
ncbi:MAG: hypothetical protein ACRD9S_05240 [Pyrinomonadaceae bacterium]